MLKILFIEDDPTAVESVRSFLKREQGDIEDEIMDFPEAESYLSSNQPDVIILDLLADGSSPDPRTEGLRIRDLIWDKHFCPIVVYSARPEVYREQHAEHPFVTIIEKGIGSEKLVLGALNEFRQHAEVLKEAGNYIRQSFSDAMRDVAPYVFDTFKDPEQRKESIKRSGRRRLAAFMDGLVQSGSVLASWEQYLFPPVSPDIMLGDILKSAEGDSGDPSAFRLVLSPSCDLATSSGRKPKIKNVLVARCYSMKDGFAFTGMKGIAPKRLGENIIKAVLTHGYYEGLIPFPCLKGRIPTMAAYMRDLEFIPVSDVGIVDMPFLRIASIDSPFRELVAWAYLNTACRPGLPDRDFDSWRDEILAEYSG